MAVSVGAAKRRRRGGAPVPHMVTPTGAAVTLAFGPEQLKTGGWARVYATVDRQGLKPIAVQDKQQLLSMSFTHTVAAVPGVTVTSVITALQKLAASGTRVRFVGVNPAVGGWWNITGLDVSITEFNAKQQAQQAELTWTLQEYTAAPVKIGRTLPAVDPGTLRDLAESVRSGATALTNMMGLTPQPGTVAGTIGAVQNTATGFMNSILGAGGGGSGNPALFELGGQLVQGTWVAKAGDTLWSVASNALGDGQRWTDIADLNKNLATSARNLGRALIPGTRVKLPSGGGGSTRQRAI